METQIGTRSSRIVADRGCLSHNAPLNHRFKVYISGQKQHVTEQIKRELRRRGAVEPVIGHAKNEHRMGRNYLAGQKGDATNVVLAAAGYVEGGMLYSPRREATHARLPIDLFQCNRPNMMHASAKRHSVTY
jgi:hypothetical protein